MKRILIQVNKGTPAEHFVWVNFPDFMPTQVRNDAITELYPNWELVQVPQSITLIYNV